MSSCRTSGEPIRWIRSSKTGKMLPLDPEPVEDGNIRIGRDDDGEAAFYIAKNDGRRFDERYISHFATCPHADQHRRKT